METRSNALFVGVIVILLTFGLITFMAWVGQHNWLQSGRFYTIYFATSVTGLLEGSKVEYQGVHVGIVDDITLETDPIDRVRVTVEIGKSVVIRQGTLASLQLQGLTGNRVIRLQAPKQKSAPLTAPIGEAYPVIPSIRAPFDDAIEHLPEMLKKVSDAADALSSFMTSENQERFSKILKHVETASVQMPEMIEGMHRFVHKGEKAFEGLETASHEIVGFARPLRGWFLENKRSLSYLVQTGSANLATLLKESETLVKKWNRLTDDLHQHPVRFLTGQSIPTYRLDP